MIIKLNERTNTVTSPDNVNQILQSVLNAETPEDRDKEHFWVFMLSSRSQIKALDLVSLGTLNQALVHPREVFRRAISHSCHTLILAHNHPSGTPEPSSEDTHVTNQLLEAGKILGIEILDHVITSEKGFYSFKQEQLL